VLWGCTMQVALGRVRLFLPMNHSLKGKRQVLRSLTERVRNRYNIAVAEVGPRDGWQTAVLGLVSVGEDAPHLRRTLEQAVEFIRQAVLGDGEVVDWEVDVFPVGDEP